MLTTKEFAEVSSKVILVLPEVLNGLSYKNALRLVEPENLKRAFEVVLRRRDDDEEVAKFLATWNVEIVEDLEDCPPVPVAQTKLIPFFKGDEEWVSGETMIKRSRQKGVTAGIRQALYDDTHAEEIEDSEHENTDTAVRVYTRTILRRRGYGGRYVLALCRSGGEWSLDFHWLGGDFHSYCRLVGRAC